MLISAILLSLLINAVSFAVVYSLPSTKKKKTYAPKLPPFKESSIGIAVRQGILVRNHHVDATNYLFNQQLKEEAMTEQQRGIPVLGGLDPLKPTDEQCLSMARAKRAEEEEHRLREINHESEAEQFKRRKDRLLRASRGLYDKLLP